MTTAIAAIIIFFIVVLVHEFGHFAVAKLVGIKVHEFSIGMGPRIGKLNKGETEYSLRVLPIGGYVRMEGEDEKSDDERSFSNKSPISRILVLLAGATMNFILALIIFFIVSIVIGTPTTEIDTVMQNGPAYEAGIKNGDKIISVEGNKISDWQEFKNIFATVENTVDIKVLRDGEVKSFTLDPQIDESGNKVIGISVKTNVSVIESIKYSFTNLIFIITLMFDFIKMAITGNINKGDVAGPIGVIQLIGETTKYGFLSVLNLAAFININLGFFNLLPIPALDGSRILFILVELVRGKPLDPEKEGIIHFIGFVFLIALMLLISYNDINRLNIF
ncbi:RIP metalloprotease RseP [Clostridium sp. D2Q-11]|uniref:Zinc metalloprotease n=1 Tax=Anaeromonas frigoriresistens TaxID=2683708 RepID=A0A942UVL5_9FIRM|nr:RIP metalloprotease RseP [Anaeromonas frigoriresistens]MBS4539883.1 RIP metalloprotease RseP [Anaeromonas frigoriresistens]